jgi:hypothetical protein
MLLILLGYKVHIPTVKLKLSHYTVVMVLGGGEEV